ncbi:MAG: hypothetical protein ACTH2Q_01470 [Propionibacteriaceae bacterium]
MTTIGGPHQATTQNELFRILGTLVAGVGIFLGSWWMARVGWLDAAALFLTVFVVGFAKDRIERGLIRTPDMFGKKLPDTPREMTGSFKNLRWIALSWYQGAAEWKDRSPNLRPMLWCAVVAGLYVAVKFAVVRLLIVATNPGLLLIGGGIALGAFIAPTYFAGLVNRFKAKGKPDEPETEDGTSQAA